MEEIESSRWNICASSITHMYYMLNTQSGCEYFIDTTLFDRGEGDFSIALANGDVDMHHNNASIESDVNRIAEVPQMFKQWYKLKNIAE